MAAIAEPRAAKSHLYCMDKAFGHDWDKPTWIDGPDVKVGRRTVYVHHRVSRCVRCGSERVEVFEQGPTYLEKTRNRYRYSDLYRSRHRRTQGEVRLELLKGSKARR